MYNKYLALLKLCLFMQISSFSNLSFAQDRLLRVDIGIIGTASADILDSALKQAKDDGFDAVVMVLDTPGGSLEATRTMVKTMMAAEVPVIVWVGPSGARAGSAGAFITVASHVAAMAPGTNIGAAEPVQASGQNIEGGAIKRKVENDTVAFMESIAKHRNRNHEMAVSFVINSLSITATEALENQVIDLIAQTPYELLDKLHGKEIPMASGENVTLSTKGSQLANYEKTLQQQFLEILSHPNIFYLLFVAGLIGIGFELTHPGVMIPGVLGGIAILLALMATAVLPINFGAMLLIGLGIAFIVAEVFVPSFGILGIGGFVAFLIGSFFVVDSTKSFGLSVTAEAILPMAVVMAGFGLFVGYLVVQAETSHVSSGAEGLIGSRGQVSQDFIDQRGRIKVSGEDWQAFCPQPVALKQGQDVIITKRDSLTLEVQPYEASHHHFTKET